jgi:hypothetical protein
MKILLSIDHPVTDDIELCKSWRNAVATCRNYSSGFKDIQMLGLGVWLILSEEGLPMIGKVISSAVADGQLYRLLLVDEDSCWKGPTVAHP